MLLGLSGSTGSRLRRIVLPDLPPTWTKEALVKLAAIERFFGQVFLSFHQ